MLAHKTFSSTYAISHTYHQPKHTASCHPSAADAATWCCGIGHASVVHLTQAVSCKAQRHANIICLLHVWPQLAEQILQQPAQHSTARLVMLLVWCISPRLCPAKHRGMPTSSACCMYGRSWLNRSCSSQHSTTHDSGI
jgi:hypothetical protein